MKYACQYAIVRFLPYVETGEFANVGVVMYCAETKYFEFKLLDRVRRITAFFEELDVGIYRKARVELATELKRVASVFVQAPPSIAKLMFTELTRTREAMLRFDKVRVVLAEDPAEQFDKLFNYYVGRNFATKAYQEHLVEREVANALRSADLKTLFKEKILGNAAYHARFPFVRVQGEKAIAAIKPLHLAQEDPTRIFDHGWEWVGKIRKLRNEDALPPAVLFAVKGPERQDRQRLEAFNEIVEELSKQRVDIIPHHETENILRFARQQTVNGIAI